MNIIYVIKKKSELDIIYKPKTSKNISFYEPASQPLKKTEVERPMYGAKTQYELNLMRLEKEKKRRKIAEQEVFFIIYKMF